MKTKISFRKKVMIEVISPTIITATMGIIRIFGKDSIVTDIIMLLAIGFFLFMLFNSYRKNFEPEDEMARHNQRKADSLLFNVTLIGISVMMLYSLAANASITLSSTVLILVFAAFNIFNVAIFLFFDIRGN